MNDATSCLLAMGVKFYSITMHPLTDPNNRHGQGIYDSVLTLDLALTSDLRVAN